jgi:uncharacterized protein YaaQ
MDSSSRSSSKTKQDASKNEETFLDRHPIIKAVDQFVGFAIEAAVVGAVVYVMHRFPDKLFPK